ncbi:hypothetical protein [Arcanobacterium canis]|uniref:Uncharacterized protein n=1 Tax=Arcanobacterium canis TaxID=999183 RepID=A0ABY8FX75_9ACTO|nr:hypothetical protein [Arcanobacterium canis]WFM83123.1 hypothetical protein P7079_06935 [Arcanobacterium canis]
MNSLGEEFTYRRQDPAYRKVQWLGTIIVLPIWFYVTPRFSV